MEKFGLIGVDNLSLKKVLFVRNQTISVRAGGGSILGEVNVTRSPLSPTDRTQLNATMTRSTICAPPVQEY